MTPEPGDLQRAGNVKVINGIVKNNIYHSVERTTIIFKAVVGCTPHTPSCIVSTTSIRAFEETDDPILTTPSRWKAKSTTVLPLAIMPWGGAGGVVVE